MIAAALGVAAVGCGGSSEGATTTSPVPASTPTAPADTSTATDAEDAMPTTSTTAPAEDPGVQPEGFSTVTIEITDADGEVCEVCVWLADDATERSRGLMGVTDLGDAAGMLFAFEAVGEHRFYMLNTPTPLSIAWFGPEGDFVSATDMAPCVDPPDGGCPRYPPGGPVQFALEVIEGGLADLGAGDGSSIEVHWDTEAAACPELVG